MLKKYLPAGWHLQYRPGHSLTINHSIIDLRFNHRFGKSSVIIRKYKSATHEAMPLQSTAGFKKLFQQSFYCRLQCCFFFGKAKTQHFVIGAIFIKTAHGYGGYGFFFC